MKSSLIALLLMTNLASAAQNGVAKTEKKTFSRSTSISIDIKSDASTIWALLTNANDFPRWNSTVLSINGNIVVGEKIELVSYLDPKRTFKIKIKKMDRDTSMVWGDAIGTRTFTLTKSTTGVTFNMHEKIGSFMFPLFANKVPSFDESFEKYAADLKKEAELTFNSK